jgi:DNA primase
VIDWSAVLEASGVSVPLGEEQFTLLCPFHADSHNSCSINTRKGVWICFRGCGQGSLKGFLLRYLDISEKELAKLIGDNEVTVNINLFDDFVPVSDTLPEVEFPYNQSYVPSWIFDRGFTKRTLKHWNAGITAENGLALPIYDLQQRMVGWAVRREQGFPKYLYPNEFKKSKVLFGGHLIKDCPLLCVVEGPLDAMWFTQLGYPAVSILGMSISKKQVELLQELPVGEIALCLDSDEAGQIGMERALTSLGQYIKVSHIELPSGYKDIQEVRQKDVVTQIVEDRSFW